MLARILHTARGLRGVRVNDGKTFKNADKKQERKNLSCFRFQARPYGKRVLDTGLGNPGSNPSHGQCVVFLGKTLYSHSASLHPGV